MRYQIKTATLNPLGIDVTVNRLYRQTKAEAIKLAKQFLRSTDLSLSPYVTVIDLKYDSVVYEAARDNDGITRYDA
jgi:hypothetical protein